MAASTESVEDRFRRSARTSLLQYLSYATIAVALYWLIVMVLASILIPMLEERGQKDDDDGWTQLAILAAGLAVDVVAFAAFCWVYNISCTLCKEERLVESIMLFLVVNFPSIVVQTAFVASKYMLAVVGASLAWMLAKLVIEVFLSRGEEEGEENTCSRYDDEELLFDEPEGRIELLRAPFSDNDA